MWSRTWTRDLHRWYVGGWGGPLGGVEALWSVEVVAVELERVPAMKRKRCFFGFHIP